MDENNNKNNIKEKKLNKTEIILKKKTVILNKESEDYIHLVNLIKTKYYDIFNSIKENYKENYCKHNINKDTFIGANAVSMGNGESTDEKSLSFVLKNKKDFIICEKTDGSRYLLIILTNGKKYLYDRKSNLYELDIEIPGIIITNKMLNILYIFDGELVECFNKDYIEYLLFDCLFFEGNNICLYDYFKRLHLIKLFEDRFKFLEPFFKTDDSIKIKIKDFFDISKTKFILEKVIHTLPHNNDGLIFTRNKYPYIPGRTNGILKWKPEQLNTIDFVLAENTSILKDSELANGYDFFIFEIYTYNRGELVIFDYLFIFDYEKYEELLLICGDIIKLNNIEYECGICEIFFEKTFRNEKIKSFYDEFVDDDYEKLMYLIDNSKFNSNFDKEKKNEILINFLDNLNRRIIQDDNQNIQGNWVFLRDRKDKGFPNSLKVALDMWDIIFNIGIKEDELINRINSVIRMADINDDIIIENTKLKKEIKTN